MSANQLKSTEKAFYNYLKTDNITQAQKSFQALSSSERNVFKDNMMSKANPILPIIINYFLPLGIGHLIQGNPDAVSHITWSVLAIFPGIILIIPPFGLG